MAWAKRGFCAPAVAEGSLDGFIGFPPVFARGALFRIGNFFLVENWIRHYVFFRGPRAKIEQAATFRAEREVRILLRIGWFLANGANVFHGEENVLPQRAHRTQRGRDTILDEDPQRGARGDTR